MDPYRADMETLLRQSVKHVYRVKVIPRDAPTTAFFVDVDGDLEVAYDLDWTPFAQARLSIKTPDTAAKIAALDHRIQPKIQIEAGYTVAGTTQWSTLGRLRLQHATEPIAGGTMQLTAMGAESIALDQATFSDGEGFTDGYTVRTGVVEFIKSWINRGYEPGPKPAYTTTLPNGYAPWLVAEFKHKGGNNWGPVADVARSAAIRVYDNGLDEYIIGSRPVLNGGAIKGTFRTGPTGTVTDGELELDRSKWFNEVQILWRWEDQYGTANARIGYAGVTTGPHAATNSATRQYTEERDGWISEEGANGTAAALLRKFLSRGAQYSFNAIAYYWLRPGDTIRVKNRAGTYDLVLVASITFYPLTGHMSITTQTPQDFE